MKNHLTYILTLVTVVMLTACAGNQSRVGETAIQPTWASTLIGTWGYVEDDGQPQGKQWFGPDGASCVDPIVLSEDAASVIPTNAPGTDTRAGKRFHYGHFLFFKNAKGDLTVASPVFNEGSQGLSSVINDKDITKLPTLVRPIRFVQQGENWIIHFDDGGEGVGDKMTLLPGSQLSPLPAYEQEWFKLKANYEGGGFGGPRTEWYRKCKTNK